MINVALAEVSVGHAFTFENRPDELWVRLPDLNGRKRIQHLEYRLIATAPWSARVHAFTPED